MTSPRPLVQYFVIFSVDNQNYALPLTSVSRVVRMVNLTPVPEASQWIAGIVNIAGRVTPVIDLRRRLGCVSKEPELNDRLLILDVHEHHLGLIVDQVSEVLELSSTQQEPISEPLLPNNLPPLLTGVIRQSDSLILVLDSGRLL